MIDTLEAAISDCGTNGHLVDSEKQKKRKHFDRNRAGFSFVFLELGPVQTPYPPPGRGGVAVGVALPLSDWALFQRWDPRGRARSGINLRVFWADPL